MQQTDYSSDETSTRELADATHTRLTAPVDPHRLQALASYNTLSPISPHHAGEDEPVATGSNEHADSVSANGPLIPAGVETPPAPLPCFLRYVDYILMRDKACHDRPPRAEQKCISCKIQWDKATNPSTFLPLAPCGHWIHYRCLIELAVRELSHKDRCCACYTPLFEWDGISTLTLAIRTDIPMEHGNTAGTLPSTHVLVVLDQDKYEQDCDFIRRTIERRYFKQLAKPSGYSDQSPDLLHCFNGVLNDLKLSKRPTSKWLKWNTANGALLFGMLVAIKLHRFLSESHDKIENTEAWVAWVEGCRALQGRIMDDVHRE